MLRSILYRYDKASDAPSKREKRLNALSNWIRNDCIQADKLKGYLFFKIIKNGSTYIVELRKIREEADKYCYYVHNCDSTFGRVKRLLDKYKVKDVHSIYTPDNDEVIRIAKIHINPVKLAMIT